MVHSDSFYGSWLIFRLLFFIIYMCHFQALVLYHLHEYPSALAILEKLYETIDDIDEVPYINSPSYL